MIDSETVRHRLIEKRESLNLEQKDLFPLNGMKQALVSQLEVGRNKMTVAYLCNFSKAYNAPPAEFLLEDNEQIFHNIPILGDVPAGQWLEPVENFDGETILYPNPKKGMIALRVKGNSMDMVAPEGSILIVQTMPLGNEREYDGKYVVVFNNGEVTFKRFNFEAHCLEPCSHDSTWASIPRKTDFTFHGVAVAVINQLNKP